LLTLHMGISPGDDTELDTFLGQNLRAADWVTAVSSLALSQVRQRVPEIIPRSSVIYNASESAPLPPSPLPTDTPRLLCLGRLTPQKGFDRALTAVASLIDHFPRLHLVIAGDGPARPELEQRVAELKLKGVVEFIGWVEPAQVPALINTATLVVMPSRFEGLPLVALEAALMARPIVGTRVDGLLDVVVHRQTGVLVEPEDPKALAEAIADVLEHPATAVRMGRAARSRARDVFSWERHVNAYDALYRKLAREGSPMASAEIP
jgi:glycogen(starch) synthase